MKLLIQVINKYKIICVVFMFLILIAGCKYDKVEKENNASMNEIIKLDNGQSGKLNKDNELSILDDYEIIEDINLLPICQDLKLKEMDIINLDDTVGNCIYETGYAKYNDGWGIGGMSNLINIYENFFAEYKYSDSDTGNICRSVDFEIYIKPSEEKKSFIGFLLKHSFREKQLLSRVYYMPDYIEYNCVDDEQCKKLQGKSRGEQFSHYYVYGKRGYFGSSTFIVIDDKIYSAGDLQLDNRKNTINQGIRNVVEIKENKILLNRFRSIGYPDGADFNNNYADNTYGFLIETCELLL